MDLIKLKMEILGNFHMDLHPAVNDIINLPIEHQKKAQAVNSAAGQIRNAWASAAAKTECNT